MSGGVLHICTSTKYGAQLLNVVSSQTNQLKNNVILLRKVLHVSNSSTRWLSSHTRRLLQKQAEPKVEKVEKVIKGIPYKQLKIGVPKETWKEERRVALTPAVAQTLIKKGFTVNVEENAGETAMFRNSDYTEAGAKIVKKDDVYNSGIVRIKLAKVRISLRKYFGFG